MGVRGRRRSEAGQGRDARRLTEPVGDVLLHIVARGKIGRSPEAELTDRYLKRIAWPTKVSEVPPHASMGFNQQWIFLTDVLPRAIKKHGGFDPEALRKASLETDIPNGGTIQGYGVKFFPPGHQMSGQNERSSPVVMQYVDGKTKIAWPSALRTVDPILPFPKGHAYAR